MNNRIAVVVPIYREHLDPISKHSIKTLLNVLKKDRQVFFLYNNLMDIKEYVGLCDNRASFMLAEDAKWFESTKTYSKLLKQYDFWKKFEDYDYVLIYQTDCLLLADNLDAWCESGYDYIGAPILGYGSKWKNIPCVGNGGLSLRKVSTFLTVTYESFMNEFSKDIEEICSNHPEYNDYEDLYFADLIPSLYCGFKKPNYKVAALFAFDRNPDSAFMINKSIPDGLHWYHKYIEFYMKLGLEFPQDVIDYVKEM